MVISDAKRAVEDAGAIAYFEPAVLQITDYYPFGMVMPERHYKCGTVNRYGFQGQESDDEITGTRSHYNYEYRVHDARIGRFYSIDPLYSIFAYNSPYAFSENKVIASIELEGLEEASANQIKNAKKLYTEIKLPDKSEIFPNIPKSVINNQVRARIEKLGKPINQKGFYLCGPAAASFVLASHDPERFVQIVFDLYTKGSANNGQITVPEHLRKYGETGGKINGMDVVDFILLFSLRDSENASSSVDPEDRDGYGNVTLPGELPDLIERTGAGVSIDGHGQVEKYRGVDYYSNRLQEWANDKKMVVLFVNSHGWRGEEESWYDDFGRHFLVINSFIIDQETGKVTVKYWDKGMDSFKEKTFTIKEFERISLDYWLIDNNSDE